MADMVDCGYHSFMAWARQEPSAATGRCWYDRWYGPFDAGLTAEAANSGNEGRISEKGQEAFKRGWRKAQADFQEEGMEAARRALKSSAI